MAYRVAGRVEPLERLARARYQSAVEQHDHQEQGVAASALGWASLMQARLARAITWFREANAVLQPGDSPVMRLPAILGLAESLALAGDVEAATLTLEAARPMADRSAVVQLGWSVASGWLAAAQGAMSEALGQFEEVAAAAALANHKVWEIQALHSMARLGSSAPATRLAELAGWVEGPLVKVIAAHAAALASLTGVGDGLDQVAERYADLSLHLYAAEAAAQACRAHQSAGHSRRAAASAARGHILLGSSEDSPPPVVLALALTPPELTRREREVAMLAARGLPSQEIATRLCLSVRTVDTHLARVYVKLGITGRSGLAMALVSGATGSDRVEAG
jgi:DNA-binding CsgD family transcriptional regulator